MTEQELKNIFKSMNHEMPTKIEMARWKRTIRQELKSRSPAEWTRMAVACLIGVVIGATAFNSGKNNNEPEDVYDDATIERVYVNLQ